VNVTTHPALEQSYHFIICGSGSSGSVVARRIAENPDVRVLLLEAGGNGDLANVVEADLWATNLESERVWDFHTEPNAYLNGRVLQMPMGKVLGGGSSVNLMSWARGHKSDWDLFAAETGDPAWDYESVLQIYRRIEDWHGKPDSKRRGTDGPVFIRPSPEPHPCAQGVVDGARALGIRAYDSPNGEMMEGTGGAAIADVNVRNGKRQSTFVAYVKPYLHRPNLTVLTGALVRRVTFSGNRATGVEVSFQGAVHRISADVEVVLSLGTVHTPKVLMHSGVGDGDHLRRFGIPVVAALPGVGRNLQDHLGFTCIWEFPEPGGQHQLTQSVIYWQSESGLDSPDLIAGHAAFPIASPESAARFAVPEHGFLLLCALAHPKSRGRVQLTGPDPDDPVRIETNALSHPDDLRTAITCVEGAREVGNSAALRRHVKREAMPGNLKGADLEAFLRDSAITWFHYVGTAKMGRDEMSVVDSHLIVYGIENLRVADASIMPRITTANTMAPCIVIGERAAEMALAEHSL
jgi:choline dehydrogenase